MKNPVLAIIALVALAGILFAQGPPSSTSAHSVVRQVELVGPIQVEGVVSMRDHISIPFTVSLGSPFYWVCPAGMHAKGTACDESGGIAPRIYLELVSGAGSASLGYADDNPNSSHNWQTTVFHPGDTLTIHAGYSASNAGIVSLELEYD